MSLFADGMFQIIIISIVGAIVGVLSGLLGIGGGIVSVPVLIAMGMKPILAVGTSSVCVLVAVTWGTVLNMRKKNIDWKAVFFTAPLAFAFAIYGVYSLAQWSQFLFHTLFAIFTLVCGILTIIKSYYQKQISKEDEKNTPAFSSFNPLRPVIGSLAGFVNGAFGVGGGIIIVPLHLIFGDYLKSIVPISLAVIALTSLLSVFLHASANNIEWVSAAVLSVFTIPGSQLGTYLLKKLDSKKVILVLIMVLVIVSANSFLKAYRLI